MTEWVAVKPWNLNGWGAGAELLDHGKPIPRGIFPSTIVCTTKHKTLESALAEVERLKAAI